MPMQAAKALFEVRAGVVPGIGMSEYTRQWSYNSDEFEKDKATPADQPTIFSTRLNEVHEYAKGLSNPAYVNWVHVDWIWI
jgi:hypothetical protein